MIIRLSLPLCVQKAVIFYLDPPTSEIRGILMMYSVFAENVPSSCHREAFLGTVSDIRPPPNISTVTLPNNHGPAHNQRVMKYIPFKNPSHQTRPASSPPPRIKFGTERRNEVWFMKSHSSHQRRKRDSCSACSFKETSSGAGKLKISPLKSL